MERQVRRQRTAFVCLALLLLGAVLLLSACSVQAPVDVNATAVALAHAWGTQTAEAQPAPSATNTVPPPTAAPTDTETPAQEPTSTSTPVSPPPTSTQTVGPKPTASRTPTPGPAPTCAVAPDPALASRWSYAELGCPKEYAKVVWSAWQPFERGYMIWMEDTDWTYALQYLGATEPKKGQWATGGESWRWDGVSFPEGHGLTPPDDLIEPIRGFGNVWFSKLGGQTSQLGWGTVEEKGFCALAQRFDKGMLVQSTAAGCGGGQFNWATTSEFKPVFLALYADGRWRRF
jgi:hypothetical protein